MRLKLGDTFLKVESIMMRNPQSSYLDNIKYSLGTHNITLWPQLAQCLDISDILQLIRANSSVDDISLLEYCVNVFNIKEAKPVIEEYKEAVEKLKMKLHQFLEERLLKASSLLKCVTIVVDEGTDYSVLNDVQRLSSDVLLPLHVRVNVIRDDEEGVSELKLWKRKSFTDTFDELTAQSKDTTFATEVPAGIVMPQTHCILTTIYFECIGTQSFQEEEDKKDKAQVMLLQEKVERKFFIQKQLNEEKEHHEEEKQFHEQVIKEYEEEILQQKREHILNEEKIAALTQQHEEATGLLKHKTEQYEELKSGSVICDINLLIDTVRNHILFVYDVYVCVIFSHV